jgi:hypothetical protein
VLLHGRDDQFGPLDQRQPGGLAVHGRAQRADDGVGAGDRAVDRVRIGDLADHDRHVLAPADLGRVAHVRGDGVPARAQLVDDLPTDRSGRTEDGHVHRLLLLQVEANFRFPRQYMIWGPFPGMLGR